MPHVVQACEVEAVLVAEGHEVACAGAGPVPFTEIVAADRRLAGLLDAVVGEAVILLNLVNLDPAEREVVDGNPSI